jgi:DNA-binding PadR family transcriptional regulator
LAGHQLKLRDVVVMGLLRQSPRYGYEIKMIIDGVMSHIIDISSGSLYYGLKKLEQQGYLEEASTEKVGRRPERSVYRITPRGEAALNRELPRVIFPHARPVFPLNLALYFFDQIPAKEQARRLKMRFEYLSYADEMMDELHGKLEGVAPGGHMAIIRHIKRYIGMERDFISELLTTTTDGSAYELDERDRLEILEELESFKQQLRYETYSEPVPEAAA